MYIVLQWEGSTELSAASDEKKIKKEQFATSPPLLKSLALIGLLCDDSASAYFLASMYVLFSASLAWGKPPPPPPPESLLDQLMAVGNEKIDLLYATAAEQGIVADHVTMGAAAFAMVVTLLFLFGVGSKPLVATCELSKTGKPSSMEPTSPSVPLAGRSPSHPHLDRRPSSNTFVPQRASKISGNVTLTQAKGVCTIEYKVIGLEPGPHGFHIKTSSDFSNGCVSAGPIYNPFGKCHGGPNDAERNVGDLGNIVADQTGTAKGVITSDLVKLSGTYSVIGRSFVVHADEDDCGKGDNSMAGSNPPVNGKVSKVTGNAGARIACGVIKLA